MERAKAYSREDGGKPGVHSVSFTAAPEHVPPFALRH